MRYASLFRGQHPAAPYVLWVWIGAGLAQSPGVSAAGAGSNLGTCPGTGDCCTANGTPGCENFDCCDVICSAVPECCSIGWTQACADLALAICEPDACQMLCPGTGDCCAAHSSAGCADFDCCDFVCTQSESCCTAVWSSSCADLAAILCDELCSAPACATTGDCCQSHGTPSCEDESCCQAVCGELPACCDGAWSQACADRAAVVCNVCQPSLCPGEGGACCTAHFEPGCDDLACCELVCANDDLCCDPFNGWDAVCANSALRLCPERCLCGIFGDFNADGGVDLRDVARLFRCLSGPAGGGPSADGCACVDANLDGTINVLDYLLFLPLFLGPQ